MAITTWQQILDALPGQVLHIQDGGIEQAQNPWAAWTYAGATAAGAAPTLLNGHLLSGPMTGAIPFVAPAGGQSTFLAASSIRASSSSATNASPVGTYWLYDRLWHNLVSSTSTSAQGITPGTLPRYADGVGVELWWETFTAMGAGTPTVTVLYTDQDGNTGQSASSGVLVTAMLGTRTGPFQLADGNTGVAAVTSWQNSATFTSGTIGAVLRRRIASFPISGSDLDNRTLDAVATFLSRIEDTAVLEIVHHNSTVTTQRLNGQLHLIQG